MRRPGSVLLAVSVVLLILGAVVESVRQPAWALVGVLGALVALVNVWRGLRARRGGVDVLALLAIVGTLATGEYFAAAILTVMVGTGQYLEERAQARAERELNLLAKRAPRIARRIVGDEVMQIDVDEVGVGDALMLASGDIVPVDGRLSQSGTFDESVLTGEALPVEHPAGDMIRSGTVNSGHPTTMLATAVASQSTYAGVIRLVSSAQARAAPFVRLADRLAFWFVPVSLVIAGLAWWLNGTATAAVAVLVVATPCPLLLAVPIAIIGGVSQCAKRGVVVKGGASLEQLAAGEVLLFDKTGTLTVGRPEVVHTALAPGADAHGGIAPGCQPGPDVTACAGHSGGQRSPAAPPRVEHADSTCRRSMDKVWSARWTGVRCASGGRRGFLVDDEPGWAHRARRRADLDGSLIAFVGVDGRPAAAMLFADRIRPDAPGMVRALRPTA